MKAKHIYNLRASLFETSANDLVEDGEETATIAAATKTQTHLTSSKNMMNTHTIKIIYQFRVLIQFIFCAFRNGAKRRNYCVPLKRWKRKREYFRSIPKLYEGNSDAKSSKSTACFFLRIADKSSAIPPCHFRYDLSHGLSVFNFIIRNVLFFMLFLLFLQLSLLFVIISKESFIYIGRHGEKMSSRCIIATQCRMFVFETP